MPGTVTDGGSGAPPAPAGEPTPSPSRQEIRAARHRRSRRRWMVAGLLVVAVVLAGAGGYVAVRMTAPLPSADVVTTLSTPLTVPGRVALPWPSVGQGAVAVPQLGYTAQSGPEVAVPVASLTKMATALVVLDDHPLAPGQEGPTITITAQDADQYAVDLATDQSNVPLEVGEQLTERQALEALLLASANDVAHTLAAWDAGSDPAFVVKMNATARALGASATHFAGPSGYDPGSVSTAADSLRVAAAGLAVPAFAEIVAMPSATIPVAGTIANLVGQVGTDGVVGVKSGFTSKAGACLVLAAPRSIGGHTVEVLVAVLGQPYPGQVPPPPTTTTPTATVDGTSPPSMAYADPVADRLLAAARAGVVAVPVVRRGQQVASVTASWPGGSRPVAAVASRDGVLLGWPGQQVTRTVAVARPRAGTAAARPVGVARARLGTQRVAVPVTLARPLTTPSFWDRLFPG